MAGTYLSVGLFLSVKNIASAPGLLKAETGKDAKSGFIFVGKEEL